METGFKKRSYVFPETGDHTIEWLGRRYMLLKADGNYKIELYQAASEYVDTDSVDYVMLDGLECMPFATLTCEKAGKVKGSLIGDNIEINYSSLDDARCGLIKEWTRLCRLMPAD